MNMIPSFDSLLRAATALEYRISSVEQSIRDAREHRNAGCVLALSEALQKDRDALKEIREALAR